MGVLALAQIAPIPYLGFGYIAAGVAANAVADSCQQIPRIKRYITKIIFVALPNASAMTLAGRTQCRHKC